MVDISHFPRAELAHLPTPLEALPRLSRHLGGPRLFVKRDDCTGLASGGNKARKLEFLLADAQVQNADVLITTGATQSNHARQTAAAAARYGLGCELLLEDRTEKQDPGYGTSGNVLLDRILGARIHTCPRGADVAALMQRRAKDLTAAGRRPYIVPGGGSNPIGALGYVDCALEIVGQCAQMDLAPTLLVCATGSCGTQAGLVAGFAAAELRLPVLGICVGRDREEQEQRVFELATATAELLGGVSVPRDAVRAVDGYHAPGYGLPNPQMVEAVEMIACFEGILIDPVYTGKAMAGLIDLIRRGDIDADERVIFLHSGGSAGLFAYADQFTEAS